MDGSIHDLAEIKENDRQKESLLQTDGLSIIRFDNRQAEENMEEVIKQIEDIRIKQKDDKKR